mmetsp:Transcript_20966/g.71005  ORF Transcript_20966/g.71005 Transcript_20966/m.71005 type:complete len:276 (+) Transcript_20966:167-994(+)
MPFKKRAGRLSRGSKTTSPRRRRCARRRSAPKTTALLRRSAPLKRSPRPRGPRRTRRRRTIRRRGPRPRRGPRRRIWRRRSTGPTTKKRRGRGRCAARTTTCRRRSGFFGRAQMGTVWATSSAPSVLSLSSFLFHLSTSSPLDFGLFGGEVHPARHPAPGLGSIDVGAAGLLNFWRGHAPGLPRSMFDGADSLIENLRNAPAHRSAPLAPRATRAPSLRARRPRASTGPTGATSIDRATSIKAAILTSSEGAATHLATRRARVSRASRGCASIKK